MISLRHRFIFAATLLCTGMILRAPRVAAAPPRADVRPISIGKDGRLVYATESNGDRVPDFSSCGYEGGSKPIPNATVRVVVAPAPGEGDDNTARVQAAINYVSSLTPDDHGIRGAVLLLKGRYRVAGGLKIGASGVVLHGQGMGEDGTVLLAAGQDRRTLITIGGNGDRQVESDPSEIADNYVPVNATRFRLTRGGGSRLKAGDTVLIRRPCTAEWINALKMNDVGGGLGLGWKPGTREIIWDRTITAVNGDELSVDAPITAAIASEFGGAAVLRYAWPGRIKQVGVENLRCESAFDPGNLKDENHAWFAVTMQNAQDVWVRRVACAHFAGGAVAVWDSCRRLTVEDCKSLAPVSELAGHRRHTFFTNGQQTLFQRCLSERGRHDFSVGCCAAGPNAFVQCEAREALDDSGPIDSWASGVLYDNVRIDGNALRLSDRRQNAQFAGWSAANSMLWQCSASLVACYSPPTARNWAIGCWGQFDGDGVWVSANESVKPASLYHAQLADRIGAEAAKPLGADWMPISTDASSSPSIAEAAALIAASTQPAPQLADWIDTAQQRRPIPCEPGGAKSIDQIQHNSLMVATTQPPERRISIRDGRITCNGEVLVGGRQDVAWWQGGIRPADVAKAKPCPTRFVPGRDGPGLTDDLQQLADSMVAKHLVALEHHYGLWYDRRDDDHERVRRMDGDAWPPFYELPFARSGQGVAWDGLSKYDLTKYNPWYFARLRQFADLCDRRGLVLINEHFFQHNVLEAGAHWASCPWRSANNINDTGFPEPPPYAGDKRIFMAEQFYDVTNPVRRAIYRAYIRKCLDNFRDNSNIIHQTSAEFTGPLHFAQFWLDTVAEWERETGQHPLIGLSATKDVQDAILADPARAAIVDVIDIRYWWYQSDGQLYAPKGGQNLAPRQHARVRKPRSSSPEQVERAVREYRQKFPDKAVIYSADGADRFGQAAFSAGGSLAAVRAATGEQPK